MVLELGEFPQRMAAFSAVRGAPDGFAEQFVADTMDRIPPSARTVGLIYDEADGLGIYADYDLLDAAFADPGLLHEPRYRKTARGYLDADVNPVPLIRLADRDHDRAGRFFALVTKRPTFSWADDGERLLRKYKRAWFESPPRPTPWC